MMKILLVEDNVENAQLFVRILETAGYQVIHKTHGLDGLKAARQETFQAILLDFDLPDMDGSKIGLSLRKTLKNTPIIALTAKADTATRNKARLFGFDAFITKPCIDKDLLGTLQMVMKRLGETTSHQ